MQITHEAVVGPYKFTICDNYLAISSTKEGLDDTIHLNHEEMMEIIPWLYAELMEFSKAKALVKEIFTPEREKPRQRPVSDELIREAVKKLEADKNQPARPKGPEMEDLSQRSAKVTKPLTLGDPDLPGRLGSGEGRIFEETTVDLAQEARKAGQVTT